MVKQSVENARLRAQIAGLQCERDDLAKALREDHQKLCIEETLRQKAVEGLEATVECGEVYGKRCPNCARIGFDAKQVLVAIRKLRGKPKRRRKVEVIPNPELMQALDILDPKVKRDGTPARRGTCGGCGHSLHVGRCSDCEAQEV